MSKELSLICIKDITLSDEDYGDLTFKRGNMCEIESVWKCGYNIKREGSMLTGNFNTSQFIKHFRLVDFVRNTQADGWVSVQDRLPRVYQLVLLLTEDDNLYLSYFDTTKWIDSKGQDIDKKYKATHWMPLPEPPKSEVKDE